MYEQTYYFARTRKRKAETSTTTATPHCRHIRSTNHDRRTLPALVLLVYLVYATTATDAVDKNERFLDKINEQSIAAVFNKVAYGSTTKRSIPDNVYVQHTTLATPLLTTYRYSDGSQEWYRVDVKEPELPVPDERPTDLEPVAPVEEVAGYGSELEKDHVLPTSAPAADILKNNNNKQYGNPNRYNNDRLRPEPLPEEPVTERDSGLPRTSTSHSVIRNVRPTKSMFGKEVPSYVPPSRSFFTPPLPPEYLNPFADKPTLRGTNSDGYQSRRPIPPPSLMPKKDRIPFRPDLPPAVPLDNLDRPQEPRTPERKKTLNTPSQSVQLGRFGEFHGLNRLHNESNFEYEPMVFVPDITRILLGTNGRREELPDVLLRTVTETPHRNPPLDSVRPKTRQEPVLPAVEPAIDSGAVAEAAAAPKLPPPKQEVTRIPEVPTTSVSSILNLPNVKVKNRSEHEVASNATKAAAAGDVGSVSETDSSHEVWHVCWNVHVYLVVFVYVLLAVFSIVKLVRYDHDTHMFSKSYFLSVHLLLTVVCILRIFYLTYDPYNVNGSLANLVHDLLHNIPLSLLATTFAVLIVFLLKRTLTHLKVKRTRPIFLVLFALGHLFLCLCLNICESFGLFGRGSFLGLACRLVYAVLCWALGLSYVYLYRIIKSVLAKKSQQLSETCTQNISYASHVTIVVALLFTLLGFVQLYGLFFIKIDRFTIPHHWILWAFELSVRLLELVIIALLAVVVSLRMSEREKHSVGFPLFPCTTSDSSTDNIYPNNCSTNLNALNYSLRSTHAQYNRQPQQELVAPPTDGTERKSTIDRNSPYDQQQQQATARSSDRFERPNWGGSQRFMVDSEDLPVRNFEKSDDSQPSSGHFERGSGRAAIVRTFARPDASDYPSFEHGSGRVKPYERCRYYVKPKFDTDTYNSSTGDEDTRPVDGGDEANVYSEPLDVGGQHRSSSRQLDRNELERRSRTSWNNSGRRSTGRTRKTSANACRPHTGGVHTLPNQDTASSMLVDENGFVRFRQLAAEHELAAANAAAAKPPRHHRHHHAADVSHYSDA